MRGLVRGTDPPGGVRGALQQQEARAEGAGGDAAQLLQVVPLQAAIKGRREGSKGVRGGRKGTHGSNSSVGSPPRPLINTEADCKKYGPSMRYTQEGRYYLRCTKSRMVLRSTTHITPRHPASSSSSSSSSSCSPSAAAIATRATSCHELPWCVPKFLERECTWLAGKPM